MDRWIWLIAGPNGAGKSTFAGDYLNDLRAEYPSVQWAAEPVNLVADERTAALRVRHPETGQAYLNLRAAREIDAEVAHLICAGISFSVETVLSSPKYRPDVMTARSMGFGIGLIYVSLHPPELSPQRVALRVRKGGHAVDPERAVERYHRSHEQLSWFAANADFLIVFDNSDEEPVVLASRVPGQPLRQFKRGVNVAVDRALDNLATE